LNINLDTFRTIQQFVREDAKRGAMVQFSTPPGTCDLQEAPGIPLRNGLTKACCAAVDVLYADILYEADYYIVGIPIFPTCTVSSSEVKVECVEVELCSNACGALAAANGVCEDGGMDSKASTCKLGSDCEDCGPRMKVDGKPSADTVQRAKNYLCKMENSECIASVMEAYYPIWAEDAAVALWTTYSDDENRGTERWSPPSCKGNVCPMPGYTNFGRLDNFYYETPTPFSTTATCCASLQVMNAWFHFETVGRSYWNPYLVGIAYDDACPGYHRS
jgi:hypothetical protein